MTSVLSILLMIFILSVIAATFLFALIRMLQPHKRKIYSHQVVKHANDKLPYQMDTFEPIDTNDEWKLNEDTGQFTKVLWDGTIVTWDNDPSGQVSQERQETKMGAIRRVHEADRREQNRANSRHGALNRISSDIWNARINRPDGYIGAEMSPLEDE